VWRCPGWTLEPPEYVTELNLTAYHSTEPFLTDDCLTIYFQSDRPGAMGEGDMWRATRASRSDPFGQITNLAAVNSASWDGHYALTGDGLQAFVATDRPGGAGLVDLWMQSRATLTDPFGALVPLPVLNTAANEFDPLPSRDGLRLYYMTEATGNGDVMLARRSSMSAAFSPPEPITELNGAYEDGNPALSADELLIIFASDRPGSMGSDDLYYASRPTRSAPFGPPQPVPGVNTPYLEGESFIACGDRELWFSSDRPNAGGKWHLYRARFTAAP
jgi:Tol biopolymer transport system component